VCALRAAEREDLPIAGVVPIAPAGLDMPSWFGAIDNDPVVRSLLRLPLPEAVVQRTVGEVYRRLVFTSGEGIPPGAIAAFSAHHRDRDTVSRGLDVGRRMLPELRYPFHFGAVDAPVMLVWGDRDRMVAHEGSERLLAALPATRYERLPGIGHCPQVESPDAVADLLLDFVDGVETTLITTPR